MYSYDINITHIKTEMRIKRYTPIFLLKIKQFIMRALKLPYSIVQLVLQHSSVVRVNINIGTQLSKPMPNFLNALIWKE